MDFMDMKPFLDGWNKGFDDGISFAKTQLESEEFANILAKFLESGQSITGDVISGWLDGKETTSVITSEAVNNGA